MLKHLANALTLLRIVLAPVIAWAVWRAMNAAGQTGAAALQPHETWALAAAALFILAALTDLFDGMAARAFDGVSKLGRILDPIADKALVGFPLIVIALAFWRDGASIWPLVAIPAAIIVLRDIAITLIRLRAPDGEGVRVSVLAKWKTALELIVVGALILMLAVGPALKALGQGEDFAMPIEVLWLWIAALILAAALSAWTGLQYLLPRRSTPADSRDSENQP